MAQKTKIEWTDGRLDEPRRPRYLEYRKPRKKERRWCCYKDDACDTHAQVLRQMAKEVAGIIYGTTDQN